MDRDWGDGHPLFERASGIWICWGMLMLLPVVCGCSEGDTQSSGLKWPSFRGLSCQADVTAHAQWGALR